MENMNDIMEDDGYAGYEADPLDDNFQVKCGQILVSATQKFSLRCAGCDLEYDSFKDFINHCIEMHSFTDFEVDTKNNATGRKSVFELNEDSNMSSLITMGPPACGNLDISNGSSQNFSEKGNRSFKDQNQDSDICMESAKPRKPLITLKPIESLQKKTFSKSEDDFRSPRKRVYQQSECRFQCKYCDKSYPYSSSLSKHRNLFHNEIKKYQCSFCDNRFTDEIYLIRHQKARHKNALQPYAEDPIILLEDFGDNLGDNKNNTDNSKYPSVKNEPMENYIANDDHNMQKHIKNNGNHNDSEIKSKNNTSFRKDKIIYSKSNFQVQNNISGQSSKSPKMPKVIYKCTMCPESENITFRSKKEWQAHENHAHLQPEKFRCQICNVGYPSKKLFQDHEQEKHQDQRPYKCPICFFAFKERKHLMRHEKVHTGEKPFKCPFCAEQFTRKDALKTHHSKEHPDMPIDHIK
ncbi:zinc finger protein 888-like [Condylostylus longicornis]|uniref:zinc finger protein 888-like n=1 Tax=Condylostylus longicornis TaxID=2530218 RepID=UPI00244E19CF|nr:zinc finger protein 888-like [Condylostylus longicornis]XP_055378762.1 zinc finger protein 888-like [Condylostylus longicornis]